VFQLPAGGGHALPGTYEKLGYLRDDMLTVLETRRKLEQFKPDYATGDATPIQPVNQTMVDQAIAYYQVSSDLFKRGQLVHRPSDSTPVQALPLPAPAASAPAPATTAAPVSSASAPTAASTTAVAH